MNDKDVACNLLDRAITLLRRGGDRLATAESCTGGMVASAFVDAPGASDIFERGYVAYSNEAKIELLTVPKTYIHSFGAVSAETAKAMAEGAALASHATVALSTTGIAGPTGGTQEKPTGLVYIAFAVRNKGVYTYCRKYLFKGDRTSVRRQTTEAAIRLLCDRLALLRPHVARDTCERSFALKTK